MKKKSEKLRATIYLILIISAFIIVVFTDHYIVGAILACCSVLGSFNFFIKL